MPSDNLERELVIDFYVLILITILINRKSYFNINEFRIELSGVSVK